MFYETIRNNQIFSMLLGYYSSLNCELLDFIKGLKITQEEWEEIKKFDLSFMGEDVDVVDEYFKEVLQNDKND